MQLCISDRPTEYAQRAAGKDERELQNGKLFLLIHNKNYCLDYGCG
jgi:hypothetical protein